MKNLLKFAISLIVTMSLSALSYAQVDFNDPKYEKYGTDLASREANFKNYAFFNEAFRMNSYGDATRRLNELLVACPGANENLYLIGVKMYRNQIDAAQTSEDKLKYVTEMMKLYDLRAEHFGTKNGKVVKYNILADKVKEMLRHDFYWDKHKDVVIKTSNQIIKESKDNLDISFYLVYFGVITNKFLEDKISSELVLSEYEILADALSKSTDPTKAEVQRSIDSFLLNSGAATCENLTNLFKPQYEKDPNNLDLIKKIMRYLNAQDCDGQFKITLAEKYYKLEPSADAAYSLGTTFAAQKNTEKAILYFKEAIGRETNREVRVKYETRLAVTYLVARRNELAADYAKRAISSDPRSGYAYFILAQAYTIGSNDVTCDGFDKKAIYWLVTSTLEKAKSLMSSDAPELREINKQMSTLKQHFPTMEDIFFKETLKVGDNYTVNCGWIKGATKVYSPN